MTPMGATKGEYAEQATVGSITSTMAEEPERVERIRGWIVMEHETTTYEVLPDMSILGLQGWVQEFMSDHELQLSQFDNQYSLRELGAGMDVALEVHLVETGTAPIRT